MTETQPLVPELVFEWDAVAASSSEAWLYHTAAWVGFETQFSPSLSFLVRVDGRVVAIVPLFVERWSYAGVWRVRVLHTGRARSGPACIDGLSVRQRRAVDAAVFDEIDRLARLHRADRLQLRLPTLAAAYLPPRRPLSNPLNVVRPFTPIRYGRSMARTELLDKIADLTASEEELWSDLDPNCRKAIRKSQAAGLSIVEGDGLADVRTYHDLHVESFAHSGGGAMTLSHFEQMWECLRPFGALRLLLAQHEGRCVAGLITHEYRGAATYWGGGSRPAAQFMRPNNLLMWEAMRRARAAGSRWFEFGPTFPALDPSAKASRIGRFKDQFGGSLYAAFEGTYDWHPTKMALADFADGLAARAVGAYRRMATDRRES